MTKEFWKFCILSMKKYKFCWKIAKLLKNFIDRGSARISVQGKHFNRVGLLGARECESPSPGGQRVIQNFQNNSLRKLQICIILAISQQIYKEPCVTLSHVLAKNINCWDILRKFWKDLIEFQLKIEFLTSFGPAVAKSRASGKNIVFRQFFTFRKDDPRAPPTPL